MKLSKRHIFKTVSWRLIGTLDTLILSWVITGNFLTGFKISTIEVVSKMVLYYIHERLWYKSNISNSSKRHLYKTFSWRFLGTVDTILIGWLVSGDPFMGLQIGFAEVVTKMILYYVHEKVWYKSKYGLEK